MYQVHFTYAMELIALALGILLVTLSSSSNLTAKRLPKFGGWIIILTAIGLLISTTLFLYVVPNQKRPPSNLNVNMSTGGGPTKTGDLRNDPRFQKVNRTNGKGAGSGIEMGGIQLPPMTVKIKNPNTKPKEDEN